MSKPQRILKRHKASTSWLRNTVLFVAIVEPLTTIFQVNQIFSTKSAEGVSLLTWSIYCGSAVIWLLYGIKIKDKPLIIASLGWMVMNGLVVVGTLIY